MNKRKKTNRVWKIISILALAGSLCCFGYAGWYCWSSYQSEKEYEELRKEMEAETTDSESAAAQAPTLEEIENTEFTGEVEGPAPVLPEGVLTDAQDNPVDFSKLQEINPELYAWIRIPNTVIDYPIAQHEGEDQNFYLHHDMYQTPQFAGCIYSENSNHTDFDDPVTVLYGHNMKNGSMFQNLHLFRDASFFEENPYMYIYMPGKIRVYEIYAAYTYDDRNIMKSFDFTDQEELENYLKESQHPRSMEARVRKDTELTADSRVVTLSTCVAQQTGQRLLVQAVLMYEENGE